MRSLQVEEQLDLLPFAFRLSRGVKDAVVTLLNVLGQHFKGPKTYARLLFIDFSLAFYTIQPYLLAERLSCHFKLDPTLTGWIMDFSKDRSQCVRVNGALSNRFYSSTSSPQGCCLSPSLYLMSQPP